MINTLCNKIKINCSFIFDRKILSNMLGIALMLSVVCVITFIVFIIVAEIRVENKVRDTADKIMLLYENEQYAEMVYLAENIIVKYASDTEYKNQSVFHDDAKFALAQAYEAIGNYDRSQRLYLDILGYSLPEYQAMQQLSDDFKDSLSRLARLMLQGK